MFFDKFGGIEDGGDRDVDGDFDGECVAAVEHALPDSDVGHIV